jgi:membrane protein DedA with SNARE-associated domain
LLGDSTLWWLGRRYGESVLRFRLIRQLLPDARLAKVERLYQKYGSRVLFMARFTPVMRAGVFLVAGWARVSYFKFILTDGMAAVISVPAIIVVTYLLGSQIDKAVRAIRGVEHWILLGIGLIVLGHVIHGCVVRRRENSRAT